MELLVIWLLLCLVPAYIAGQKGNSAAVAFLVSLLLSPLIGLIIVVIQKPKPKLVPAAAGPPAPASAVGIADELAKLGQLRDAGHITQEEFDRQRAILLPPVAPPAVPGPSDVPIGWGDQSNRRGQ